MFNFIANQLFYVFRCCLSRWNAVNVSIGQLHAPFRLLLEAERGAGSEGYVALDDVTLRHCNRGDLDIWNAYYKNKR